MVWQFIGAGGFGEPAATVADDAYWSLKQSHLLESFMSPLREVWSSFMWCGQAVKHGKHTL